MTPPGGWELVVLVVVLVVLFGATRLPGAARSLGQSMRIFKAEIGSGKNKNQNAVEDSDRERPSGDQQRSIERNTE